ncbi:MAG: hypothetical protein N2572_05185 [Syntrophales bacterium]|nr:hypothetical protein [Syntrophales bacterium]
MLEDYFRKTVSYERPFYCNTGERPNLVIVIPAYAEKEHLFKTLRSVAENPADELEKTLVICVINNEESAKEEVRENNRQTVEYLHGLITGQLKSNPQENRKILSDINYIKQSPLRIAYIDAFSQGYEIPDQEKGAGTARKIGMDMALRLLWPSLGKRGLIASLDADTSVEDNYLSSLRAHRSGNDLEAFVIDYEHPRPEDPFLWQAICHYEIFLRFYVLGLSYARSPYAYHVMGSAFAITTGTYLAVRGMSRRKAGEDFYFLNKTAKVCPLRRIRTTRVFPAARLSNRVPFGTGASLQKRWEKGDPSGKVYHPEAFYILAKWLNMAEHLILSQADTRKLVRKAASIHRVLAVFLEERRYPEVWENICKNTPDVKERVRRFHEWFDAFQTLKLIRMLHGSELPMISIAEAWDIIREKKMLDVVPLPDHRLPENGDPQGLLNFLRRI